MRMSTSKTRRSRCSREYGRHVGMPSWFGSPVRAKLTHAVLIACARSSRIPRRAVEPHHERRRASSRPGVHTLSTRHSSSWSGLWGRPNPSSRNSTGTAEEHVDVARPRADDLPAGRLEEWISHSTSHPSVPLHAHRPEAIAQPTVDMGTTRRSQRSANSIAVLIVPYRATVAPPSFEPLHAKCANPASA